MRRLIAETLEHVDVTAQKVPYITNYNVVYFQFVPIKLCRVKSLFVQSSKAFHARQSSESLICRRPDRFVIATALCGRIPQSASTRLHSLRRGRHSEAVLEFARRLLIQAQRFDSGLIDCTCNRQAVFALEIGKSGSRLNVQGSRDRTKVKPGVLKGDLHIGDHLIGQQITVRVNRAIVIVIVVERIIAPGWIPVTRIQKIISAVNKNDGRAISPPPIVVMPFVPVTAECVGIAEVIIPPAPTMPSGTP